ncbi:Cyclohexanone monooxygenase [hydrothermal vent metagenome]|uniref:Cyclohexanone monooxygenase n=1 Tax=hydrothermal vent metagenome TaxID=652676 RepID=A0A3B0S0M2_9ZZZZ
MSKKILDVAIIGAGFAGIGAAVKLRQAGIKNVQVFEKTDGIGGTWYDNTYPGAACDVPSHLYCYSFAPNPAWSRVYSPQAEIQSYIERVVDQFQLRPLIRLQTQIIAASFDGANKIWLLQTKTGEQVRARFVVWSVAFLGTPQIPDFPDLAKFEGPVFHSARWDHQVDLAGKNVVIVGSAASALQIGPVIAPQVKSLTMFQRTANYVMQRDDRNYSNFTKTMFRYLPFTNRVLRWLYQMRHDKLFFQGLQPGNWMNRLMRKRSLAYLSSKISDPELRAKLTGDYELGCKRILISDDFYDMFLRDNVQLLTDGIARFDKSAIHTKTGQTIAADVVIMATGFAATSIMPDIQITGIDGQDMQQWRKHSQALKGLLIEGFPNSFFMLGPNTGLGHSSMILMIESQLKYMLAAIKAIKPGQTITPKAEAVQAYNQQIQAELATKVWATSCKSWYKQENGFNSTMWPRSTSAYEKMMKTVDWDELDIR